MSTVRWSICVCLLALLACRDREGSSANPASGPPASSTAPTPVATTPPGTQPGPGFQLPRSVEPSSGRALFDPSTTHGVISGVLTWADPALSSFSAAARKDRELYQLLRARGVPASQLTLLLDSQATTKAVLGALSRAAKAAPTGSTLVFYYAGHGVKAKSGKALFASYDIQSASAESTGLSMSALVEALGAFRGKRVLLLADCCYSGALAEVARSLRSRGVGALSLTSAEAANVSTGNWTYTQAIIDGLSGDPLCDENADGQTTVAELASEVRASMLFREGQRSGSSLTAPLEKLAVAKIAAAQPEGLGKGSKARRRYVEVSHLGRRAVARVRAQTAGKLTVRLFDYATSTDAQVAPGDASAIEFRRYPSGKALRVYWGGKIWDAKVTRADGDFLFITYPGWPAHWDEWITSRRVAGAAASQQGVLDGGTLVSIEWRGDWYPGTVLRREGARHLVDYDGYGDEWNEWVGAGRLRRR